MIIEYIALLTLGVYATAAVIVWVFELKKNALYFELQKQIKFLESLHISAALKHIKLYKIMEDYRRANDCLENVQRVISEKVLFVTGNAGQKKESYHG